MLKNVASLGSVLNKQEQKFILGNGGCFPLAPCGVDQVYDKHLCACVPEN